MRKLIYISILFILPAALKAQDSDLSFFAKGGISYFYSGIGDFGGGHIAYENYWNPGVQISLGAEIPIKEGLSLQPVFLYSSYSFDRSLAKGERTNSAMNRLYEVLANVKFNLGAFYLSAGAGLSYQNADDVNYLEQTSFQNADTYYKGRKKLHVLSVLGMGLEMQLSSRVALMAEADLNIRHNTGTAYMAGIKYSLSK